MITGLLALVTLLGTLVGVSGCGPTPQSDATVYLVDHQNLRRPADSYVDDLAAIRAAVAAGRDREIDGYVLFSRGFEDVLTYQFPGPQLPGQQSPGFPSLEPGQPIGPQAWGPEDERWGESAAYRAAVAEAAGLARAAGLAPVYHTNQFDLPEEVAAVLQRDGRPLLCADDPATWDLYANKIDEFFRLLPEFAGLQVTADEAEHPIWRCVGEESVDDAVRRLVEETARALPEGKALEVRAWGRVEAMSDPGDLSADLDRLPPAVQVSVKNTRGDFQLFAQDSPFLAVGGPRLIVEFDAWREYSGWNYFPCYMGAIWEPRIREFQANGGSAYAFRFNWSDGGNLLFERPWGNVVNLDVALAMIRDGRDHREALTDWVADTYPPEAEAAAVDLYLASTDIQRRLTSLGPVETTDHARLFREHTSHGVEERVADSLDRLQSAGHLITLDAFDTRRQEIDAAVAEARDLVAALPASVDAGWRAGLLAGIAAEGWMAHGTTDQLEMLFLARRPGLANVADRWVALDARIADRDATWQAADPASFADLNGDEARAMYAKLATGEYE